MALDMDLPCVERVVVLSPFSSTVISVFLPSSGGAREGGNKEERGRRWGGGGELRTCPTHQENLGQRFFARKLTSACARKQVLKASTIPAPTTPDQPSKHPPLSAGVAALTDSVSLSSSLPSPVESASCAPAFHSPPVLGSGAYVPESITECDTHLPS